ncbi:MULTISPECIES: Mu transposase C-terminal domain-containing protein [Neptuniibacter]|jgi:putative transposase|uniref:Mu transposase C-terminal domain-containing protein n=1 Tax=Neptuniibacter TaxID=459520 RepID=UPI00082D621C|nr:MULTISPECIES: Mu transposase C-terminal domain-containing protein [Neptuniibacter]MDO6514044.1 Mu transposase C-terminal domain-containing protein [Neptuniibacter sp. 2_MG-2023]
MKLASFRTGQHLTLNSSTYEIIRTLENKDAVLERKPDLAIVLYTEAELSEALSNGTLSFIGNLGIDEGLPKDVSCLSEKDQEIAFSKFEYIQQIIARGGERPSLKAVEVWIDDISATLGDCSPPSPITIYRWWRAWFESGKDISSLAPKQKLGRRSFYVLELGPMILDASESLLLKATPHTKSDVYDYILANINESAIKGVRYQKPSKATFYRLLDKLLDPFELMAAQKGKTVANKFYRMHGAGYVTSRILERVEIDHTPLNIFVVDENTKKVIGRPNFTLILDHFSKMPLGFYIGFEPPSSVSVMRAIRHAILSKDYVSKEFPSIRNSWPAYGCFTTLACDNGSEFHDHQLRRMCNELNTELFFCPSKQPHYKGSVERFLGTLNRAVCHKLKGTSYGSISERGEYESTKLASVTLDKLRELIHKWVIDIYIHSPHAGLDDTPANVWKNGLKDIELILPQSRERLDLILTKEYVRKLSHEGIRLFKLNYSSDELRLFRQQLKANATVHVRIDPENVGKIWVLDKANQRYFSVPCTKPEYAEGISLRQHRSVLSVRNEKKVAAITPSLLQAKKEFTDHVNELSNSKSIRAKTQAAQLKQNPIEVILDNPKDLDRSELLVPPGLEDFDVEIKYE